MSFTHCLFVVSAVSFQIGVLVSAASAGESTDKPAASTRPAVAPMEKHVSKDAVFVLYKSKDWRVSEGRQPGVRTLSVAAPDDRCALTISYGFSAAAGDIPTLTRLLLADIGRQFPDFALRRAMISKDRKRLMIDAAFTSSNKGKRELRCWVSGTRGEFLFVSIETEGGQMARARQPLLTILSNLRIIKGAFVRSGPAPIEVKMAPYRLGDGSAGFDMPEGWACRDLGKGNFIAGEPTAGYVFMVASVDILTPDLGVTVPGVPVSRYLAPSKALPFLCSSQGLASGFRMEKVFERKDMAEQMAQVYTAGPVAVEEFVYACDTKTGRARGYTMGFSFGSRTNSNWNFRHLTVMAPADRFDAFAGNFAAMLHSYRIDDEWARKYIAEGMVRLYWLQQQTIQIVNRNAQEIRSMMQAAYEERQRSMDYIDYQRTNYIRGEQDWISGMEGGAVYHTDSWGTKNTATGEYWEGAPYDYVHFEGASPRYNESMTPINSRELWDRHFR